jgi:hypothetical protein
LASLAHLGGIGFFMLRQALTGEFKVARVGGPARLIRRKYRQRQRPGVVRVRDDYDLHIGDQILKAQGDVAGAINQGDQYIFYYVESTKDILSVEAIRSSDYRGPTCPLDAPCIFSPMRPPLWIEPAHYHCVCPTSCNCGLRPPRTIGR